jgi:nucleoporin NUP42
MLPPNYMALLPAAAKAAFEREQFEWGMVPEWVPPRELR